MRGFFGIGIEGVSKALNVGSLMRTAHAFDAAFVFTVSATYRRRKGEKADTSRTDQHIPFYSFPDAESMVLPHGCELVGVEITDDAIDLPSFHHPKSCAYVMGPERGQLSDAMLARCAHVVKIPTRFSVNVSIAGALVMYDRHRMLGGFAERHTRPGAPLADAPEHVHGGPIKRTPKIKEWSIYETDLPPIHPRHLAGFMGGTDDTT